MSLSPGTMSGRTGMASYLPHHQLVDMIVEILSYQSVQSLFHYFTILELIVVICELLRYSRTGEVAQIEVQGRL